MNRQINAELQASHAYLSMAAYFSRDNVALPGLHKFFLNSSHEEREHAEKLISYQGTRGGRVHLDAITAPEMEWKSARNAVETALQMEKAVNASLLDLHKLGEEHGDSQLCDYIATEFLEEQVKSLKEIADMLTNLNRVGNDGVGLFLFDKELERK